MSSNNVNLDETILNILKESGKLDEITKEIINEHRGQISEAELIEEIRSKGITMAINQCAELGLIDIKMDNDGQAIVSSSTSSKQNHPGIDKIKLLEEEFKLIDNGGFPIPIEELDLPHLSKKTKLIVARFANWLSEHLIKIEVCSYWEAGKLFEIFRKVNELNYKIKPTERERIREIINRSRQNEE